MRATPTGQRAFIQNSGVAAPVQGVPGLDDTDGWGVLLSARERVFLSLCAHSGSADEALAAMVEMAGVDRVSGEQFDLGEWAGIAPATGEADRLYAGMLMDPKCEAFHRLVLQGIIAGPGAAVMVKTIIGVMESAEAKDTARVAASRLMADLNGMLARIGVEQGERVRETRDRALGVGAGAATLPSAEALARAEAEVERWRQVVNQAETNKLLE